MESGEILKTQEKPSTPGGRLEHVTFKDIKETYWYDQPLKFAFTVDSSLCPTEQDKIGLYTVGWRSVNDHLSFVSIKLPLDDGGCGTATLCDLPRDEEEFYQLCYIGGSSQVHGASIPFQFVSDDFEIVDDLPDASLLHSTDGCRETDAAKTVNFDYSCEIVDLVGIPENQVEETAAAEDLMTLNRAPVTCSGIDSADVETKNQSADTFYPLPTWFHNPYCNYIPANITAFAEAKVEYSELWPNAAVIE